MVLQKQVQLAVRFQQYGLAIEEIKLKRSIEKISDLLNSTGPNVNHKFLKSQLARQQNQLKSLQELRSQFGDDQLSKDVSANNSM